MIWLPFVVVPAVRAGTTVVIDAGHGGTDGGSYWGGVKEKDLTLDIAKRVEALLKAKKVSTAMTRRTDRYVPLETRAAVANSFRKAIFVSIHCNADAGQKGCGIETHYFGSSGRRLATYLNAYVDKRTTTPNRGLKFSRFVVLHKTRPPAALVECGFLSAPKERQLLKTVAYRQRLAQAIADGVMAYLR